MHDNFTVGIVQVYSGGCLGLQCVGVGEFVFVLVIRVVVVSGRERIKLDPARVPKEAQRLRKGVNIVIVASGLGE